MHAHIKNGITQSHSCRAITQHTCDESNGDESNGFQDFWNQNNYVCLVCVLDQQQNSKKPSNQTKNQQEIRLLLIGDWPFLLMIEFIYISDCLSQCGVVQTRGKCIQLKVLGVLLIPPHTVLRHSGNTQTQAHYLNICCSCFQSRGSCECAAVLTLRHENSYGLSHLSSNTF